MTFDDTKTGVVAAAGSGLLLATAWTFQAFGYAPCSMCILQRYPHVAAVLVGILVLLGLRHPVMYLLGAAAAATTGTIAIYHTGVERDWWEGPTSCTGSGQNLSSMDVVDLLSTDAGPTLVMCDQVAWEFLSISMASWNAIGSFGLMLLWIIALRMRIKKRRYSAHSD
ncbi:disulfide bond formation protein B [Rhodobacteraceae bacterium M385]|nr:disulfide bond formation protein B [Rhodobacteraceae bacterium M385]